MQPELFHDKLPVASPLRKGSAPRSSLPPISDSPKPLLKAKGRSKSLAPSSNAVSPKLPRAQSISPVSSANVLKRTPGKSPKSPKQKTPSESPKQAATSSPVPAKSPREKTPAKSPKQKTPSKSPKEKTPSKSPLKKTPTKSPKTPKRQLISKATPKSVKGKLPDNSPLTNKAKKSVADAMPVPTPGKAVALRAIFGKVATPKLPTSVKRAAYRESPRKSGRAEKPAVKLWSDVVKQGKAKSPGAKPNKQVGKAKVMLFISIKLS